MKHDDSRAGFSRYSLRRNADGIDVPDFPAEPGKTHAVIDRPKSPHQLTPYRSIRDTTDTDFDWEYTAVCGATVRTLLTISFDDADEDACFTCASLMSARAEGPEAYAHAVQQLRDHRNRAALREREREQEREDVAAWNRQQNRRVVRNAFPALRETPADESPDV